MNLGMLLSWEQVYLSKIKEQTAFETDSEIREYLKEAKKFDEYQINSAFEFYQFANKTFTPVQWQEVEKLFEVLDEERIKQDTDSMIEVIGEVLWNMGNLFGTNDTDDFH